MAEKRVEFEPPKDFVLPEGVQADEDFDMVCTLRMKGDTGKLCVVKVGDSQMPGYGKGETKSKPSYAESDMMNGMREMGAAMNPGSQPMGY